MNNCEQLCFDVNLRNKLYLCNIYLTYYQARNIDELENLIEQVNFESLVSLGDFNRQLSLWGSFRTPYTST